MIINIALMMGTEMVSETSVIFNQMTWLIARDYFINVGLRENFRSYILKQSLQLTTTLLLIV
jgi:hypothetical protein